MLLDPIYALMAEVPYSFDAVECDVAIGAEHRFLIEA